MQTKTLQHPTNLRLKQNPYHFLLLTGLVLVLSTFFLKEDRSIDIHVHDTYYVIAHGHVFYFLAFLVWVLWFLYLLTRKILFSTSLTWVHVVLTLLAILFLLFLLNVGADIFNSRPVRYLDYSNWTTFNGFQRSNRWIAYTTGALLLGQITYVVNLVAGTVKRIR